MKITWTRSALKSFNQIKSRYFTETETIEYKKKLVLEIEGTVITMMRSTPARERGWQGTYRIIIDNYKVFYSLSKNKDMCIIEGFIHHRRNN